MKRYDQDSKKCVTLILTALLLISTPEIVDGRPHMRDGKSWRTAHATFYGGADASGTMGNHTLSLELFHRQTSNPKSCIQVLHFLNSPLSLSRISVNFCQLQRKYFTRRSTYDKLIIMK